MKIRQVYDNMGTTFDRYTVVFESSRWCNRTRVLFHECLSLSPFPDHPQGISMFGETVEGPANNGRRISYESLPDRVKLHLQERIKGE